LNLKKNLLVVAIVICGSMALAGRQRCFAADLNNSLKGNYAFQTSGTALLTGTSGCVAPGADIIAVPAALHGILSFDGNGNITSGTALGFDIAGTVCDPLNYQVSGSYEVQSRGHGAFAASGVVIVSSHSPFARCALTLVNGMNFSLTGDISNHSIMIVTFGGSGTFSEGGLPSNKPPCTAGVQDFVSGGSGSLQ
jgi:hypothetical protein